VRGQPPGVPFVVHHFEGRRPTGGLMARCHGSGSKAMRKKNATKRCTPRRVLPFESHETPTSGSVRGVGAQNRSKPCRPPRSQFRQSCSRCRQRWISSALRRRTSTGHERALTAAESWAWEKGVTRQGDGASCRQGHGAR
jgi:hypothetical protein